MKNELKIKIVVMTIAAFLLGVMACENPTKSGVEQEILDDVSQQSVPEAYDHGSFTTSEGIYRIPYADGTDISGTDHHTHAGEDGPRDQYDLFAGEGSEIVAAASGWIVSIVDHHGDTDDRGDGYAADGVTPQDDSAEHSCLNDPDAVEGSCADYNNSVVIEHPNGERTLYLHLGTGTVQLPPPEGAGLEPGDWVEAGEVIGLESDVGYVSGGGGGPAPHLHFHVNHPDGFQVVPLICDIPDHSEDGIPVLEDGVTYTAAACSNNELPEADAGGPYEVDEGSQIQLDGTGSSDPEGLPLSYRWESDPEHEPEDPWFLDDNTLVQPTFTAIDAAVVDLTLTVYDQVEALDDADNTTVTVNNVGPTVTIDPNQVSVIDEEGTVTVTAVFTDPGWLDTHTASIDWGVPAGQEGDELAAADIQILNSGGPDDTLIGQVTGTYQYGDNDDGSGFTIEVTVTDDDGATDSDSFSLTVNNLDPDVTIDDPLGAPLLNGVPTVVASVGDEVEFNARAGDAGSDDLTLTWDWDDGTSDSRISRVNPPDADPLPSPTMQLRIEPDQVFHEFAEACLYEVAFSATDDDGGHADETLDVIIAGLADQARGAGYWTSEYRMIKNPDLTPATLECYLDIVNHASMVFSEQRILASIDDAVDILWTRGKKTADEIFDRQLLTAWLNVANGAYALNQMVDTTGDDLPDTPYQQVLEDAETLRTDPTRPQEAVLAMKDLLEELNTADE